MIRFWKDSPKAASSPTLTVIAPAVVGDTFAPPVATSVPRLNVATLVEGDIVAPAITVSSPTLAVKDTPLIKGDPTFCTPPPLTEANANSANDP